MRGLLNRQSFVAKRTKDGQAARVCEAAEQLRPSLDGRILAVINDLRHIIPR